MHISRYTSRIKTFQSALHVDKTFGISFETFFYKSIAFLAASLTINRKRVLVQTCRQSHLSVGLSGLRRVYCGKTADWIWMPFGMVSGVSRGMGVLDRAEIVEGEGAVLGVNIEHPIVTNGDFTA